MPGRNSCCAALALVLAAAAPGASAQEKYPVRPIRLIIPYTPAGGTDLMGRTIAQQVAPALGVTVVVDNRPGGASTIGTEMTARAVPDGYTLVVVTSSYAATAALYKLPYDPVDGIQPVILVGTTALLLTAHPSVPTKSVPEFIAYARARPGKLNWGSSGTGGMGHLAGALFKLETKTDLVHVPFKGTGPVMTSLLGGEVQLSFSGIVTPLPYVRQGRLRALGVTTPRRSTALPDVPAIGESVPGFEITHWYGVWGPKGLPPHVIERWNREVTRILATEEMKARFAGEGIEPAGGPPERFREVIRADVKRWTRVVREEKIGF